MLTREDEAVLAYLQNKGGEAKVEVEGEEPPPPDLPRSNDMADKKAGTGTLVAEFADEFPKVTRAGAGIKGPRRTDVDVVLEQLEAQYSETGTTSRPMKVINYNVDAEGNEVDREAARGRAHARVQALRKRGYTKDKGWKLAAIDGEVWAQFYGEGNHPVSEKKAAANGQVEAAPAADSIPAPVAV